MVKLKLELSLEFRATSEISGSGLLRSGPPRCGCDRTAIRPISAIGQKVLLSDCASCTGLVMGERFRALIGFVWPARNGTASDTAAAGSDGSGSVLEPVPKLNSSFPPPPRLPPFYFSGLLSSGLPFLTSALNGLLIGTEFRATSEISGSGLLRSGPPRCGCDRTAIRPISAIGQKVLLSDCASCTGLVMGERSCNSGECKLRGSAKSRVPATSF